MPPITIPKDRLRLAIQKSGRLSTDSLDLLKNCGIRVKSPKEKLLLHAENFPIDILFVRDDDIPQLVMDGVCDLGVVGTNVLEEAALQRRTDGTAGGYFIERTLDFGACRLAIALPEEKAYAGVKDLQGLRIATSYPNLTRRFLDEQKIRAEVVTLSGSVEIAPRLGLADIICDLVSSGSTLEANKLRAVETIFKSTAALIRNTRELNPEKAHALEIVLRRLDGVQKAADTKYIMLHAPKASLEQIKKLLPGSENPTILPLARSSSAASTACRRRPTRNTSCSTPPRPRSSRSRSSCRARRIPPSSRWPATTPRSPSTPSAPSPSSGRPWSPSRRPAPAASSCCRSRR